MFEFEYQGHRMKLESNGTIWQFRTSEAMPNEPPDWYRTNYYVIEPIVKEFFAMEKGLDAFINGG